MMAIVLSTPTEDGKLRFGAATAEPVRAPLEALLRNGQQAGDFRECDVHVMAGAISAAIDVLSPVFIATPIWLLALYGVLFLVLAAIAARAEELRSFG